MFTHPALTRHPVAAASLLVTAALVTAPNGLIPRLTTAAAATRALSRPPMPLFSRTRLDQVASALERLLERQNRPQAGKPLVPHRGDQRAELRNPGCVPVNHYERDSRYRYICKKTNSFWNDVKGKLCHESTSRKPIRK